MFDFIPLEDYSEIYINIMLMFVIFNLLHAYTVELHSPKNIKFLKFSGYILLMFLVLYIGLRPVSGRYFGDMATYTRYYQAYAVGEPITIEHDIFFHMYMKFMAGIFPYEVFFVFTAFIYIYPMYRISVTYFNNYWFYAFFMFIISFSFWSYGTNGIRNGIATSLFLWGLCYKNKKVLMIGFFVIAYLFHRTLLLPILAYTLTYLNNNSKLYLKGWLLAIPFSLALGSVWVTLFTALGFGDDGLGGYIPGVGADELDEAVRTGFRWDFLIYSAGAVFAGWYFIVKRKFDDEFYKQLFNTYLICNGFWILVIRANFSNRFAYLSWFLMAIIIIYPYLKERFFNNQQIVIAKVTTIYFLFTYLMELVYYS